MCVLEERFKRVVMEVTGKNLCEYKKSATQNGNPVKCEDQFVATIEITNSKVCFIDNDIKNKDRKNVQKKYISQNLDTIALILESPNSKEFSHNECLGPAMGKTGDGITNILLGNIAKFITVNDLQNFGSYFKTSSEIVEGVYKLLIINAVQYQCSLGDLNGKSMENHKDDIFKKFFDNDARKDFVKRLKQFNPKIIINCCTGGHYRDIDGLQEQVQEVIDNANCSALRLIGAHPSSAYFARGFYKK